MTKKQTMTVGTVRRAVRNLALLAAVAMAIGARAATETVGDYTWTYSINGDTAEIYKGSSSPAISPEPRGAVVIPSTLGGKPVTSVGYWAFAGCIGLTGVTLPNSLTNIGEHAFDYTGLKSVTIPNGVTNIGDNAFVSCGMLQNVEIGHGVVNIGNEAFLCCSNLTSLSIGSRVTRIGWHTFEGCRNLMAVTIPDSVTSIDSSAFSGCSKMTSLILGNRVTYIGGSAFSGCSCLASVTIPDSVTSLASSAFSGCNSSLFDTTTIPGVKLVDGWVVGNTVPLPSNLDLTGVRGIADQSFYGCTGLVRVTIPNGVTRIGSYAFAGCSGLTDVVMPNSVTSIGNAAFFDCSSLTSVTIPGSVKSIEANVFNCCSNLTSVTVPASVTNIGLYAFSHCSRLGAITVEQGNMFYRSDNGLLLTKDGKSLVAVPGGLAEVDIPDGVERIGKYAFYGCRGLTSVTIPDSVTSIGERAFSDCSGLTNMTIPESLTNIESRVFYNCNGLTSVTIPGSVMSIGERAFYNCSGLTSVTIGDSVTSIGQSAFSSCSGLTNITFAGNAPSVGKDAFAGVVSDCCVHVRRDSTGWGVDIPGTWKGIAIDWYDPPVPAVTDVAAKQRYPWNGLVDITCTVSGIDGTDQWKFSVAAVMPDTGNARQVSQFWVVKNGVNSTDKKVQANGTYKLLWDAKAELGQVAYDNMVMRVTVIDHDVVQLWEGGPYWATTNIGAEKPEDYGYYFWWGDTVGYKRENNKWVATDGSSSNFSFSSSYVPTYDKDNSALLSAGYIDSTGNLVPAHDAAHVHWGGDWRMPTSDEIQALISNCTTKWITTNGVSGRLVTGKGAYEDRSIFLPAAGYGFDSYLDGTGSDGYCWSSTPDSDGSYRAWYLYFNSGYFYGDYYDRCRGQSVRPVRGFAE